MAACYLMLNKGGGCNFCLQNYGFSFSSDIQELQAAKTRGNFPKPKAQKLIDRIFTEVIVFSWSDVS